MPSRIRKPIIEFAFRTDCPVRISPQNAPIVARGIVNMMTRGVVRDSKADASTIYIRMNAAAIRK